MHRKVLPWSFALKMMIEHVYGEWAAVHCNEDQGRSWILDTAQGSALEFCFEDDD